MEEKWKVYIRGNKDRGKEVIKALTDLGAKNPCKYIGSASNHLYHIGYDGNIYLTYLNSEYGHIIMDNYHELHLSEQWKRGDILFSETHKEFAVFESDCIFPDRAECYFVTDNRKCLTDKSICKKDFRLATGSEIALFYNYLHFINKSWDAEKKQLVKLKQKPTLTIFWIINFDGESNIYHWY